MKVSGFTFVRNATLYGLPVVESIRSILPLVDEFIVNVGVSGDPTLKLVKGIGNKKLKVFETKWDDQFPDRMRIYAEQTNLSLARCTGDWCFYLQADEVVHEKDHDAVYGAMERDFEDPRVQGLLFDWVHFWGDHNHFLDTYVNYQKEVRIIRNSPGISSWLDAQGFRLDGRKLRVKHSGGTVYHYGWVVPPEKAVAKSRNNTMYYWGKRETGKHPVPAREEFYQSVHPYFLSRFKGTHPAVMKSRIKTSSAVFTPGKMGVIRNLKTARRIVMTFLYRLTGLRLGEYRNYTLLR